MKCNRLGLGVFGTFTGFWQ